MGIPAKFTTAFDPSMQSFHPASSAIMIPGKFLTANAKENKQIIKVQGEKDMYVHALMHIYLCLSVKYVYMYINMYVLYACFRLSKVHPFLPIKVLITFLPGNINSALDLERVKTRTL